MDYGFAPLAFERTLPPSGPPPWPSPPGELCRSSVYRELDVLAEDWVNLEARAVGGVFQSYAWCSAWAEANRRCGRFEAARIVTVWVGSRLVLLWPLSVRRWGPFRVLKSFAHPATQYCDALVEDSPERARWLELAWDSIRAMGDIDAVHVVGVRDDAVIAPLVASRRHVQITRLDAAPFIDFRPTAGPVRRRSSRTRNALQRHLRSLSSRGATSFETVGEARARVSAVHEMLDLKHAWLARTARVSTGYAHPANHAFLMTLAGQDDFLLVRLTVGGTTAAVEGGILRDGYYWSLVQSYDERFAAHGPGRLVFWHMIQHAAALRIDVFDFLAPSCPHKVEWANGAMPVRDAVVPLRIRGWGVVVYVRHFRLLLKRCAAAMPRWCRAAAFRTPRGDRPTSNPGDVTRS